MRKIIRSALVGALALAAVGVASAPAAQGAGREVTTACANVVVLGVRGSGEPPASSKSARTLFGTRTTAVANKIKDGLASGTSIKFEGISYPAVSATDWKNYIGSGFKASNMDRSVASGRDALVGRINHYKSKCPSSKLVIIGYSQGAWVAHDAIAKYGESASKISNVAAIVLLADPANVGSKYQTVMVNSDGKPTGADPSKVKGVSRVSPNFTSTLQDWSRTISYCADRDIVCSVGSKSGFDAHSKTYTKSPLVNAAASYALTRLKPTNRNGVCNVGEFCAYKDANLKKLVLDVAAPKDYKRIDVPDDQVSSIWNRTSNEWHARNQRTGRGDATILKVAAGKKIVTPSNSWNDKIDHFNVH